jgi:hypothetical protein
MAEPRILTVEPVEVVLPRELLEHPEAARFEEFLVRRGELTESEARELTQQILDAIVTEIGDGWGAEIRPHVMRILELRTQVREMWSSVLERFSGPEHPTELPAGVSVDAFDGLFAEMEGEFEQIRDLHGYVDAMQETDLEGDIHAADEARQAAHAGEVDAPHAPDVLLDPIRDAYQRRPGVAEQERIERLYYMEGLRDVEPEEVRAILEDARETLFGQGGAYELPAGWEVRLVKSPEYGARIPQQAAFADADPLFAANGYELNFTTPEGIEFQPDGVHLLPDGSMRFLEFKDPLVEGSIETYRSRPDLQQDLAETMIRRAETARSLPNCTGWTYDSSLPGMNDYIFDVLESALPQDSPLRDFITVGGRTL